MTEIDRPGVSARVATPPEQEITLLIADVASLTGVPAPQLRSWEQAGLLQPRRAPNAIRIYGIEDVARARLIKRSLINPGRRGSLRRLAAQLADGTVQPQAADYAGLRSSSAGPAPLSEGAYWRAVVDAMDDAVLACDAEGRRTYANPALSRLFPRAADLLPSEAAGTPSAAGAPDTMLPSAFLTLPLRWAARTGTYHRDIALGLQGPDGREHRTLWTVTPLRGADGTLHGAVALGRVAPEAPATQPNEWLALMVHDLRGPVTNVLGRVELARRIVASQLDGTAPEATTQLDQHLAHAERSTAELTRMIDTLLAASAAASGALTQHLEPGDVALDVLARDALAQSQAQSTRHLFTLELPETPVLVTGDRQHLRQVFDNLLANAVKYAPDGGPIILQLEVVTKLPTAVREGSDTLLMPAGDAPQWALVRVADTGLGIPAAALPYVFDRYWRATDPSHAIPGIGLGLYACRAIVAAHGGHIWIEHSVQAQDHDTATSAWHGTVVALVLPLSISSPDAAHAGR